jgi:hypothetical protein
MRFGSREVSSGKPRTYVGRFLRAALLDQREERSRLERRLNGGKSGWNDDEPAVFRAASELMVRRYFLRDVDVREITKFVSDIRAKIHSATPPDQLEAEAVIRAALGEKDIVTDDIRPAEEFNINGLIVGQITRKLRFSEADIDELIADSERIAFEQGWNPPLAK